MDLMALEAVRHRPGVRLALEQHKVAEFVYRFLPGGFLWPMQIRSKLAGQRLGRRQLL